MIADKLRKNITLFVTTNFAEPSKQKELRFEFLNKMLTTCTAGKLMLGYPESIIPEEIPF